MGQPADESAPAETPEEHVRREQLFALIWAHRDQAPPEEGEGADPELARMFRDLGERYRQPLAPELRLGPETAARWWRHATGECDQCRLLLVEDGPDAPVPQTRGEKAAEVQRVEDKRREDVRKFWIDLVLGTAAFGGAYTCIYKIRAKQLVEEDAPGGVLIDPNLPKQIDPLWFGFAAGILVASWFLAEAYSIARRLWVDFTAWKRAVPVIGKKWAAKGKPPGQDDD